MLLRWTKQYGGIFRQHLGTSEVVLVITDPQEVARLSGREEGLPKWHNGYKSLRQVLKSSVIAQLEPVLCSQQVG